ncbi:formyltransferase family protein [Halobacteria archaeon AArc-dxtr1]|nr:formyltransferase family protein [Halobacteria archaeon AArc-dxtr1]
MAASSQTSVGILCEQFLYEWQRQALTQLRRDPDVDVSLVVTNATAAADDPEDWNGKTTIDREDLRQFLEVYRTEGPWAFVMAERALCRRLGDEQPLWHRHDVENLPALDGARHVQCVPQTDGAWYEFPDSVVDEVAERCDVAVLFGFGLVRGEILSAPEHGVLGFHPADIREYRGMGVPPAFYEGRDCTGVTLQRLTESIDGGDVIATVPVQIADCDTLWDAFDRLAAVQASLLGAGVSNAVDPAFESAVVPESELGTFYPRSQRRTVEFAGTVLVRNLAGRARRQWRRFRGGSSEATTADDADVEANWAEEQSPTATVELER